MKISVSLTPQDLAAVDRAVVDLHLPSRSAVIQLAIRALSEAELEGEYAAAWTEWEESGAAAAWEDTTSDGLHASR